MKRALPGLLLVASLALVALWSLRPGRAPEGKIAPAMAVPSSASPAGSPELAPTPDAQPPSGETAARPASQRVVAASKRETFPLDDARWIDVAVELPPGVPADEELEVVVAACPEGSQLWNGILWSATSSPGALDEAMVRREEGFHWARRPLPVANALRVPVPPDAGSAAVLLCGRYVRAPIAVPNLDVEEPLQVRLVGKLGAWVEGVCSLPGVPPDLDATEIEVQLASPGFSCEADVRTREVPAAFEFRGVPAGSELILLADHPSLAHAWQTLRLEAGTRARVELALRTGATVEGFVRGEAGEPMPDATVRARTQSLAHGGSVDASTDDDGHYELRGIEPGDVVLSVQKDGWLQRIVEPREMADGEHLRIDHVLDRESRIAGTVRWPDGAPAARAALELASARQGRIASGWASADAVPAGTSGLALTLEAPLTLAGRVVDGSGLPFAAFELQATSYRPYLQTSASDAADGRFELPGLAPGSWNPSVVAQGIVDGVEPSEVELPGDGRPVTLVVARACAVGGVVLDPDGRPAEGASIAVDGAITSFAGSEEDLVLRTDREGRFELDRVPPRCSLVAQHEDWADSEPLALEVAPGGRGPDVVLRLRVGGRVTGQVFGRDGEPAAGQNVAFGPGTLVSSDGAVTDSEGCFAFEHVVPGRSTLTVSPPFEEMWTMSADEGVDQDAAMINLLGRTRSRAVDVVEGGEVHVVFGAPRREPVRLSGRVTEAGAPRGGLLVSFPRRGSRGLGGMVAARSDDDGRYEVELAAAGPHVVAFGGGSSPEGMSWAEVDVPDQREARLDLALPLGRMSGRVREADGAPAAGAAVQLQRAGGAWPLAMVAFQGEASEDGAWEIGGIPAGTYTARFRADGPVRRAVVGGVRLDADGAVEGIDVVLEGGGTLVGAVRDACGDPVQGAWIFVRDAEGRLVDHDPLCQSGPDGAYRCEGLPPGAATVLAQTETSTVVLERDGAPVLGEVVVLDRDGAPVGDLFALATFDPSGPDDPIRIGPLVPGRYTVRGTADDGREAERRVFLRAGHEARQVRLRFD